MLAWLLLIGSLVHAGPVFIDLQDAQTLLAEGAAVIDARGEAAWKDGHLPDSWPLDWTHHRQGWRKSGLLTDDTTALEKALEKAGVRDDQSVLVIGAGRDGWGEEGRWYWALEYLGHPSVHVFNGGWPAWVAAGGATTLESRPPIRGSFTPRIEPSRRARTEEVAQASRTGTTLVWDTREDRAGRCRPARLHPTGRHEGVTFPVPQGSGTATCWAPTADSFPTRR